MLAERLKSYMPLEIRSNLRALAEFEGVAAESMQEKISASYIPSTPASAREHARCTPAAFLRTADSHWTSQPGDGLTECGPHRPSARRCV